MLTILHTNDLHGHVESWEGWEGDLAGRRVGGFDYLAGAIARARTDVGEDRVLLLDAGDAVGDTMVAAETQGRAVLQLMSALRYDALCLGNHEPDFAWQHVRQIARASSLPLLAGNVIDERTGEPAFEPLLVRRVGGVQVGVLGLAYPNTPFTTAADHVQGLRFDADSAGVVRRYVPQMKARGAELIIVLSHLGLSADRKLARAAEGIDVIVGGHSHNRMHEPMRVGDTLIVQAGAHGSDLGRLDLEVAERRVVRSSRALVTLDHEHVTPDADTARRMESILSPLRPRLDERLGTAVAPIVRAQTLAGQEPRRRDAQSPADSLFADILRAETGSDIALLPGVGYGVAIPAGPITVGGLRNLVPHASKVVTLELTGAQIRRVLEQAIENTLSDDPKTKVGGMIQVSGIRFSYDPGAAGFSRLREVHTGSAALDEGHAYRVATNTMLAQGGHNYAAFREGRARREHDSQFETIARWIRRRGDVRPPDDVRISAIGRTAREHRD